MQITIVAFFQNNFYAPYILFSTKNATRPMGSTDLTVIDCLLLFCLIFCFGAAALIGSHNLLSVDIIMKGAYKWCRNTNQKGRWHIWHQCYFDLHVFTNNNLNVTLAQIFFT